MGGRVIPLFSGLVFGAAIVLAGIWPQKVIIDQMNLRDDHMILTYIAVQVFSTITIYLADRTNYVKSSSRSNSTLGWLGAYDANVIGGLMQGFGMALSGSCPATLVTQVALGVHASSMALLGGMVGACFFVLYSNRLKTKDATSAQPLTLRTVPQFLGVNNEAGILLYLAILAVTLSMKSDVSTITPYKTPLHGGLMIGLAQAVSITVAKKSLGISSAYQELATMIMSVVRYGRLSASIDNVVFAIGTAIGSRVVASCFDIYASNVSEPVSTIAAFVGGFVGIFGSRLAGGCTSGHGISGASTLSISSFITIASMAVGGIALRALLI